MSLCPYCLQKEKEFFSSKCNECNTEVSFSDQVGGSLLHVAVQVMFWIAVIIIGAALI